MRRFLVGIVVVLGLATACGNGVAPSREPPPDSGVRGLTKVDGGCPVVRAGDPCRDKAMPATVIATRLGRDSAPTATVHSGKDGRFVIRLAPGRYRLVARAVGLLPAEQHLRQVVVVRSGSFSTVGFRFDSGIR
jgi:carboxypeptidase family protein